MSRRFPGGIVDPDHRRAFVATGNGEVRAIDLGSGRALRCHAQAGEPVAATQDRLITITRNGQHVALKVIDAATGANLAELSDLDLPPWAAPLVGRPDALTFKAVPENG